MGVLYSYQQDAVDKLRSGSILCGGVGSGKSRTALAFWKKCGQQNLYVITTPKKRDSKDWEREGALFGCAAYNKPFSFVVDSWANVGKYIDVQGAFFIFDEQRAIGKGAWAKAFIKIAKKNQWILLSATPGDNWSDYVSVFIANGYFRNRTEFNTKHCVYSRFTKYPKIERYVDTDILEKYRKEIVVTMEYKREKIKHTIPWYVRYATRAYNSVANEYWDIYQGKPIENPSRRFMLMRKVVNANPERTKAVSNILRLHPKVVIFYNFDYELMALKMLASEEGILCAEWNGHKHEPIPEGSSWMYLVHYTAGAEAWECTDTDTIIFYSLNYSYKTMVQSAGRTDRVNSPFSDLYYYILLTKSSIDKAAVNALKNKKDFNDSVFESYDKHIL